MIELLQYLLFLMRGREDASAAVLAWCVAILAIGMLAVILPVPMHTIGLLK